MSRKCLLLIYFVLSLSLASVSYGDPAKIKVDMNQSENNNDANTVPGFFPFVIADSGSEVNDVNGNPSGIIIDLEGDINDCLRAYPYQDWIPPDANVKVFRDFIFGVSPSGINITLWGLGKNQQCEITIYALDAEVAPGDLRMADWTGNGAYLFTTVFGQEHIPWISWLDYYTRTAEATADKYGRLKLESTKNPESTENEPFAYVNGLSVVPLSAFVESEYAQRPQPFDGTEDVHTDVILSWKTGGGAEKHDVYLGTDFDDVNDCNRTNHHLYPAVLFDPNQDSNSYDPYDATGLLKLNQRYYWRVDEVNTTPEPQTIAKGEVWSFTTVLYVVVDDFDSYATNGELRDTWQDGFTNGTRACVHVEYNIVRDGNSMKYDYLNDASPYYAEAAATTAAIGLDPNWSGMGAKSLSLWFYGQSGNDTNEQMYVKLHDADSNSKVMYDGNPNDVKKEEWQEWNIDLSLFDACGVDLTNVAKITIGFGDGVEPLGSGAGTVYFDDIRLYASRCVLSKRSDDFAKVDYAPLDEDGYAVGDCVVNYQELAIMSEVWLYTWYSPPIVPPPPPPPWPPSIPNLVAYWPMDEGDGNKIYPEPNDPCKIGTLSEFGVSWVTPGSTFSADAAVHFDGKVYNEYPGEPQKNATVITCGRDWSPIEDGNELTLAVWVKWAGPHVPFRQKCQPIISMRKSWNPTGILFSFECDAYPAPRGSFYIRQLSDPEVPNAVYSPAGILDAFIGQWTHLACTYDGTDADEGCRLYLNGIEVASGPFRLGDADPYQIELTLGNHDPCGLYINENFHGDMDEVCIYNRALTTEEIEYLAGWYPPWPPSPANLYDECCWCPIVINFKDFAVLSNYWLEEFLWP